VPISVVFDCLEQEGRFRHEISVNRCLFDEAEGIRAILAGCIFAQYVQDGPTVGARSEKSCALACRGSEA
jgi:hypothetical protein